MKIINISKIYWCLGLSILLFSCGDAVPEKTESNEEIIATESHLEEDKEEYVNFEFHEIIANLPSPVTYMKDLEENNVPFNKELLCPKKNAMNHETITAKAINCGIYLIDATYLAAFHQSMLLPSYLATAHELSKEINANHSFDKIFNARLEQCLDNKDSLTNLMNEGLDVMEEYLTTSNRLETATQLLVGSWIETQYIVLNSLKETENASQAMKTHIFEQRYHLEKIIELMHEFKDDAGLHKELEKFQILEGWYIRIHENKEVKPEIIMELTKKVEEIRNDMIGL